MWLCIFTVFFALPEMQCIFRLDTSNISWTVYNEQNNISVPAKVPGGVYESLKNAGILDEGDFYYRYNDINYRYVSHQNWTYKSCFQVPEELQNMSKITMEFEGLDTISTLILDGVVIGTSNNMFTSYEFDVTDIIKAEDQHRIEILFSSPTEWAKKAFKKQAESYPVVPVCVPKEYNGECHANHIRKMQASFAWDWGPAFPDMGIWKPLHLVGWNSARIKNVLFSATPIGNGSSSPLFTDWEVNVKIIFDLAVINRPIYGKMNIKLNGENKLERNLVLFNNETELISTVSFIVDKDDVELWWPNGYGNQSLYDLEVSWLSHFGEMDETHVTVGFRKIELDQSFVNSENVSLGRHFRVKVNNVGMFLKGSNWIPAHVLTSEVTDEYTVQLLEDAAVTHQNCIRVWGGGIYESDAFYEAANKLGILIWQDFMFACSMYPASDWFLDSVSQEVRYQTRRLQSHPSVFLWGANNENEAALADNWYGTQANYSQFKEDYIRLYVDEIWKTLLQEDQSRYFLMSSPTNGIESIEEGYVADNPYDGRYGDVHYYNYMADAWKPETYPMTRFASEYGFQSWPSFRTLSKATSEEDWKINSDMMYHRQHHIAGETELSVQILTHFHFDFNDNSSSTFKYYLYLTQIHQAMAIKTETEFYLRQRAIMNEKGEGLTSGALYWQLNDIWQGASWSSIEYGGRWKILHNFMMKLFDPILISPVINDKEVHIYIINDMQIPIENASLKTCLISYLHMNSLLCLHLEVNKLKPLSSTMVVSYDLEEDFRIEQLCSFQDYSPTDTCFLLFSLTDETEVLTWDSFLLLGEPKDAALRTAHVQITNVHRKSPRDCELELISNNVAMFVWLETDYEGYFIDNGFIMSTHSERILFHGRQEISCGHLAESIDITTLTDTYQKDNRLDNLVI